MSGVGHINTAWFDDAPVGAANVMASQTLNRPRDGSPTAITLTYPLLMLRLVILPCKPRRKARSSVHVGQLYNIAANINDLRLNTGKRQILVQK